MAREGYDPYTDQSAATYPGGNAPYNTGSYSPPISQGGGTPPGTNPYTGQPNGPYSSGAVANTTDPNAAPGTPAAGTTATTSGSGSYGPDVTLGPDGHVYGTARNWDNSANGGKGGYVYSYADLGSASDLNAVSAASGIPVGQLQVAVLQQQQTLSNLYAQGAINPYAPGGMTQQQLTQSLDQVRTATQYNTAMSMQQVDPATGLSYQAEQDAYNSGDASFRYGTQAAAQSASAYGYQRANDAGASYNTMYANGVTYGQQGVLNDQAQTAQQAAYNANYGSASGVNGMSYGQLGLQNNNSQAVQQYASSQNYNAANPYSGMSNGQTGMQAGNVSNAMTLANGQNYYSGSQYMPGMSNGQVSNAAQNSGDAAALQRNQYSLSPSSYSGGQNRLDYEQGITDKQDAYNSVQSGYNLSNQAADNHLKDLNRQYDTTAQDWNLGSADYTGGATRQEYQQGTQDILNPYNRSDAIYKVAHQANQQNLDTYREGVATAQAKTQGQSRNLTGLGWAGISKPLIQGWT